jgi:hypothetical protein
VIYLADDSDSSTQPTLQGLGLEQVIAIRDSNGQQVGPFFKEDPDHIYPKYDVQGGVLYAHGQLCDGSWAHVALSEGKVPIGEVAFGGSTETLCDKFDIIEGVPHKRVLEEDKRTSLKDSEGRRYTGVAHKTIDRDRNTPLESRGTVYHVTDQDDDEGYWLNEKLCGKGKGMAPKSELVPAGDDVHLVQSDKDGYVIRIVDIDEGDLLYVDERGEDQKPVTKKCTGVKFVQIGREWYALKSFHDETGEKRDDQWLRTKDGKVVYEGLTVRIGKWFEYKTGKFAVRTYDETGRLIIAGKNRQEGKIHYIKKDKGEDPVKEEATDGPKGDGIHEIDGEVLVKLFLWKKDPNPAIENDDTEITYRREDTTDAFGGPHDEEVPSIEGRSNTIIINGRTGKLFKDRATREIYWMGVDGRGMFGRGHWNDPKTIEWKYGFDGARLAEGQATILKHVEDVTGGHTVIDYQNNAYCQNSDSATPKYHKGIRDFWVLSYEGKNMLVAETEDSVGLVRRVKNFSGWGFLKHLISPGKWFPTPSTYCAIDGTTGKSIAEVAQKLEAPNDYKLVKVDEFEDTVVRSSKTRESQVWKSPAASARGTQALQSELAKAEGVGDAPSEHSGLGMSGAGNLIFGDEDPITGKSAADLADDAANAAPGQSDVYDASSQQGEEGPDQAYAAAPVAEGATEESPENGDTASNEGASEGDGSSEGDSTEGNGNWLDDIGNPTTDEPGSPSE